MAALTRACERILQDLQSRQRRRKSPYFVVEGVRTCTEAVQRRPDWIEFAVVDETIDFSFGAAPPWPVYRVTGREVDALASTENTQGVLLVCRRPEEAMPTVWPDPFVLLLDQVRDPGNVGTILRTAWAAGLRTVAWTVGTADPWSAKTIRSGMGAQFAIGTVRFSDVAAALDALAPRGYSRLWQATPHGGTNCFSADFDLAGGILLFGNETADTRGLTGSGVCIPMPGSAESLNVGQAATILLFEAVRRGLLPSGGGK